MFFFVLFTLCACKITSQNARVWACSTKAFHCPEIIERNILLPLFQCGFVFSQLAVHRDCMQFISTSTWYFLHPSAPKALGAALKAVHWP